jgi:putative tryptophan/tyrosine transport system substrate-binding protein
MAIQIRRREFVVTLGGAVATLPLAAHAQQPGKLRTIGLLAPGTVSSHGPWFAELVRRLHELGWIENRNIAFEYRWGEGRSERYGELAAELVRSKVDVIVTTAPAFPAAQRATSVIPIVFALSGDPVATGFIASLARPGGNATGLSMLSPDTVTKRRKPWRWVYVSFRESSGPGPKANRADSVEIDPQATLAVHRGNVLMPVSAPIKALL